MTCVVCPALATAFPANRRMSADDYAPPNGYASRVHQRYHGLQAPRGKRSSLAGQSGHRADDRAHAANSSVVVGRESFRFDVCARGWRAAKWRKSAAGPHPSPIGRLPMAANQDRSAATGISDARNRGLSLADKEGDRGSRSPRPLRQPALHIPPAASLALT